MKPISELRKALYILTANAFRQDKAPSFASIPARPDVDADLVLSAALDELEALRDEVLPYRMTGLEPGRCWSHSFTGHFCERERGHDGMHRRDGRSWDGS